VEQLPQERLVIAVRSTAILETQLSATLQYVSERKVFGNRILDFQNTKFNLAEAKAYIGMLRAYVDSLIAVHLQQGVTVEQAASAKLVATEMLGKYLDTFLQLHGGYGYSADYGIGRAWVDARVSRIAGGASEVLKDIISRSFK
jgi:acyl-CoA dehydrogenase